MRPLFRKLGVSENSYNYLQLIPSLLPTKVIHAIRTALTKCRGKEGEEHRLFLKLEVETGENKQRLYIGKLSIFGVWKISAFSVDISGKALSFLFGIRPLIVVLLPTRVKL